MSTILKALKKVEGKRAVSTVKLDMPNTPVGPKAKNSNVLKWLVTAGLLLIVVISVVAGYQFWQTDKPTTVVQKTDEGVIIADKTADQPSTVETSLPQELLPDKKEIEPTPVVSDLTVKKQETVERAVVPKPVPQEALLDKPKIEPVPAASELSLNKPKDVEGSVVAKPLYREAMSENPEIKPAPIEPGLPINKPKSVKGAVASKQPSKKSSDQPVGSGSDTSLPKKRSSKTLLAKSEPKSLIQPQSSSKTTASSNTAPKAKPTVAKKPKKPDVPLLEDRSLEIQALVYSKDAAKRMIVLNGEILRQGYEYKGYTIEAIESKRVLVKKKGKVSALPFGK